MVELNKNDYDQALALVNTIEFNTFFAKSVIKNPIQVRSMLIKWMIQKHFISCTNIA